MSEILDSRTSPHLFPPVPRLMMYGPNLPQINFYDLTSELLEAQLRIVLHEVRRRATRHVFVQFYDYAEQSCEQFADLKGVFDEDMLSDRDAELIDAGLHSNAEDGPICLDRPGGLGCSECVSEDCERVQRVELEREEFWQAIEDLGAPSCRVCGCTDDDCSGCIARTGRPCAWVPGEDALCTACVPAADQTSEGQP
jgi:hypothetical protein